MFKNYFFIVAILFSGLAGAASKTYKVTKRYKFKPTAVVEGMKYVDVTIVNHSASETKWKSLKKSFDKTNKLFTKYGVGLNLVEAIEVRLPMGARGILSNDVVGVLKENEDFYRVIEAKKYTIHPRAKKIYTGILNNLPPNKNMIYLMVFESVSMKLLIKNEEGEVVTKNYPTGAFSNPPYMFGDRIPKEMRGIIGLGPKRDYITMAHELGHKLINVSHEGKDKCPAFSGRNIPGLLGYGGETGIFSGEEGRFHLERLHLSPFIYKVEDGQKVHNPDYEAGGSYFDPIYGANMFEQTCI